MKRRPIMTVPEGGYRFDPKDFRSLVLGNWYYGWDCPSCRKAVAVVDDPSKGKAPIPFLGEGANAKIHCPHCLALNVLPFEEMKLWRHVG